MSKKLTIKEKYYAKEIVKTITLYVAAGIVLDKALDYYIKK